MASPQLVYLTGTLPQLGDRVSVGGSLPKSWQYGDEDEQGDAKSTRPGYDGILAITEIVLGLSHFRHAQGPSDSIFPVMNSNG